MSSDTIPPNARKSRSDAGDGANQEVPPPPTSAGKSAPSSPAPGTASADDLGLSLIQVDPDPLLEEFHPVPEPDSTLPIDPVGEGSRSAPGSEGGKSGVTLAGIDLDVPPSASAGEGVAIPGIKVAGSSRRPRNGSRSSTSDSIAALDLYAPSASHANPRDQENDRASRDPDRPGPDQRVEPDDDDDDDEEMERSGPNWPVALLASYASAVTIGLIWVLWGHRAVRERPEADPFPGSAASADPGRRADRSRKIEPPAPIAPTRRVRLGETLRLGALEVTPRKIEAGPVILQHAINKSEQRLGGTDALVLTLTLRNVSHDSILAPLDEAFIRQRGRGIRDSFVEVGPDRRIEMYPLAVVSEWSIHGQEFRELAPGESYETQVMTDAGALGKLTTGTAEMIWRLRLRTDVNQTETLGIPFQASEVGTVTGVKLPEPPPPENEL